MDGALPCINDEGSNNLRDITLALVNTDKQPNQIFAILCGMGIPKEKAYAAVITYVVNKNNNIQMEQTFDMPSLKIGLLAVKEQLVSFKDEQKNKFNYNTTQALSIVESYLTKISGYDNLVISLEEKKNQFSPNLDLKELNGSTLYSTVENLNSIKKINEDLEAYNKNIKFKYLKGLLSDLKIYEWIVPVGTFVSELTKVYNANYFTAKVNETIESLSKDKFSKMYEFAINDLNSLIVKKEDEVRNQIPVILEKHKWIKNISDLIVETNNYENAVNSTGDGSINSVYSPLQINENGTFTFSLNKKYYVVENDSVREAKDSEMPNGQFILIENALSNFKISKESLTLYGKKTLNINLNENKVTIDNVVVDHKNLDNFRNALKTTMIFGMNELYKIDEVCQVIDSLEMIKELDFVTSIQSKFNPALFVNIIGVKENFYVNVINPLMGTNTLVKPESGEEIQKLVSEYVNIDISNIILEKISFENKQKVEFNNKIVELQERLTYLESKKDLINKEFALTSKNESVDVSDCCSAPMEGTICTSCKKEAKPVVEASEMALNLINDEISKVEKELQETYMALNYIGKKKLTENETEKKKIDDLLDAGYVEGYLKDDFEKLKKGDKVFIMADEFTSKGDSEIINVVEADGKKKFKIHKKLLKVK